MLHMAYIIKNKIKISKKITIISSCYIKQGGLDISHRFNKEKICLFKTPIEGHFIALFPKV